MRKGKHKNHAEVMLSRQDIVQSLTVKFIVVSGAFGVDDPASSDEFNFGLTGRGDACMAAKNARLRN